MQRLIIEIYSHDGTSSYPVVYESKEALIEFIRPKLEQYKQISEDRVKIMNDWKKSEYYPHHPPQLPTTTSEVIINDSWFYIGDMADDFSNILTLDEFFAEAEQTFESSLT